MKRSPISVDTMQINKISLENYDNKRLRSINGIVTYPYGTNTFKVCFEGKKINKRLLLISIIKNY